jgi:hypothetical protein
MEANSAWPDLWDIAHSGRAPADVRTTLLVMQADLFASAPAHDRETIESFEAIALGFLPLVDDKTVLQIARLVAACPATPGPVLAYLVRRTTESALAVAALAPHLPAKVIDILLGSRSGRVLLATRSDLDSGLIERLLSVCEGCVDEALIRNPSVDPAAPVFGTLVDRARTRGALARALLGRCDLTTFDEASLYLVADEEQRKRIRNRVAGSARFRRPQLPLRLTPSEREALTAIAAESNVAALEHSLNRHLGLSPETAWTMVENGRHELLAIGLAALGLAEEDAIRIFLSVHPAISHSVARVFAMTRTFRQLDRGTALTLLEAILAAPARTGHEGRHQPAMSPTGTPARPSLAATERSHGSPAEPHRRSG